MATNAPSRRRREPRTSDSSNNNISRNSGTNTNAVFANSDNVSEQQRRREKKRAQNRLSQQSCREKQASYVRQLERFVENIQAAGLGMAASGGTESQAYTQQLQNRLWNTMKENQELRDAMLRMRKKMMSLSASAQSGADDIIFERVVLAPPPSSAAEDDDGSAGGSSNVNGQLKWDEPAAELHTDTNNTHSQNHNHSNISTLLSPIPEDTQNLFTIDFGTAPDAAAHQHQHQHNQHQHQNQHHRLLPMLDDPSSLSRGSDPVNDILTATMPATPTSMDGQMMSLPSSTTSMALTPPSSSLQQSSFYQPPPIAPTSLTLTAGGGPAAQHHHNHQQTVEFTNHILPPPPPPPPPLPLHPDLLTPAIPNSTPFGAPFYPLPSPNVSKQVSMPDYHDAVVDAIERRARDAYNSMRFSQFKDVWKTVGLPPRKFSAQQVEEIDHMTLSDVCKTALRLMLKCSSLEKYAYALGTTPITEKILRWRLHPTPFNRAAIPEPFHPTPLQHLVHDRPASIDFIHWRELRDQLILYKGNYDMRTLLKDSLDGLVREAPPTGIALPIMEYYTKLAELGGDVVGLDADPDYSFAALEYDPNKPYQPCTDTTVEGARRYGLHRLHERKLSEAFAKKYPFLDVTTITTKYPVIHWKDIGKYEHLLFKDPRTNA